MDTNTDRTTTAAQYRALVIASTDGGGQVDPTHGPDLVAKGYARLGSNGLYWVTPDGMDHVDY